MRFAIATLGCKVNQYDSAMIESRMARLGFERCEFDEVADVYVVNTCTVTDRADAESLRIARRARRLNPEARVIMTGCLAQASPQSLDQSSAVDAVVGLGRPNDLEAAVLGTNSERTMVSNLRKERAPIELGAVVLEGHTRAFLKVQEGCDQFCSFCIVPTSRGRSRSVGPRRILEAIDGLYEQGFKEVILTGIHLGGYGKDLEPAISLEALLEMIDERAPVGRIRISSLDPEELSDRIIEILRQSSKFCHHLHLPLQAGTDETLGRMRRRYRTDEFRERVDRLMAAMPDIAIGTDLIAGFPGESSSAFDNYFKFVESLPLAYFHVFPYSSRAGTTAAKMDGQIDAAEIKRRAAVLRELGETKRRTFATRFNRHKLQVLLEESAGNGLLRGYSRNYLRVLTRAELAMTNHEVEVEVTNSLAGRAELVGEIVGMAAVESSGRPAPRIA
ncbi:MAG TPA: tRNA (N(6)-L-threonylcarbamoyladenosine(37)-C(2))-methylthiotransferase MtaB [Candidatus Binataceae bacterium]|nr:tRNA (N(6)-L-threonylcarbamoyladenosine(37)-C(2))-methylthiotransferase MtaB [Candidatus Binataceae bacterium]